MLLLFFIGSINYPESRLSRKTITQKIKMSETYRFKFTTDCANMISNFAKIHQYDDRKDFKEAWKVWCETNADLISNEKTSHDEKGYKGDILLKMYNSARYYYRNKSTAKKEPIKRKEYYHIGKDILQNIDKFIGENKNMKPSNGFEIYYNLNRQRHNTVEEEEKYKSILKKTYKNRCYNINKRVDGDTNEITK